MTVKPTRLLDQPTASTIRTILLGHLDAWDRARARLKSGDDSEAVHDFRVALRRIRTVLRGYRSDLPRSVPKSLRRLLKRLVSLSGTTRDLEVQRQWVDARVGELTEVERAAARWLLARLARDQATAQVELERAVERYFAKSSSRLRRRFEDLRGEDGRQAPTWRVVRRQLASQADDLSRKLGAIVAVTDAEEIHRARIATKRLRYLIEPFAEELHGADELLGRLRGLQDLLGDLHDRHRTSELLAAGLRESAVAAAAELSRQLLPRSEALDQDVDPAAIQARPALLALARLASREAGSLFATVEAEWLDGRGRSTVERSAGLIDQIRHQPAGVEIERKFLLSKIPDRALTEEPAEIEQGWIPGKELLERVRRVHTSSGDSWYRTVKLGSGISRVEIEESTTRELFESLWPLTTGKRVRKRRYPVRDNELTWEIDAFDDRDLVMAEVELPAPTTPVVVPEWLRPFVVREVTEDPAFVNYNLAG
jgi:CHAD domain-containing protein/CYTH domain-containing protein